MRVDASEEYSYLRLKVSIYFLMDALFNNHSIKEMTYIISNMYICFLLFLFD